LEFFSFSVTDVQTRALHAEQLPYHITGDEVAFDLNPAFYL